MRRMSSYNIKMAWRNLKAHRFYSILNITGLSIGMATSILVLIWVHYQFSFDKFNHQYEQVYRLNTTIQSEDGAMTWGEAPSGMPVLTRGAGGIAKTVRLKSWDDQNIATLDKARVFDGNRIAYIDPDFLSVFDYPLIYGNKKTFLNNIDATAITQSLARKLFGTDQAVGKKLRYFGDVFEVGAVLKDFPENSSLQYSALFPMSAFTRRMMAAGAIAGRHYVDETIDNIEFQVFLLLTPAANPAGIAATISKNYAAERDHTLSFSLQPLKDLHLISADGNPSDLRMVQILLLVAILVLVVASINYMNLTTARSLVRLKEVSVRKVNGAAQMQLFWQFMTEALVLFLVAALIALLVVYGLLPAASRFTGVDLSVVSADVETTEVVAVVFVGTLLVATLFPAYLLSGLQPSKAIKGVIKAGRYATLRKILVVIQFSASFILMMGAIVIHRQMHYLSTKDVGYDKSYAFVAPMTNNMVDHAGEMETELLKSTAIEDAGVADVYDLAQVGNWTNSVQWPGKPENGKTMFAGISGDKAFVHTMRFRFIAGGNFSATPADSNKVILNEVAAKRMQLKTPYTGQQIVYGGIQKEIIGVVKSFNYQPLTQSIGPLIIDSRGFKNILYVRTTAAGAKEAIAQTERLYKKYSGNAPFTYTFLDKSFADKYLVEQRTGRLLKAFSAVALFISCLGLLGLATYTAEVKKKEIGIRKVLGASVGSITGLITGQFLKLVLWAVVVGAPVAYLVTVKWQSHFAYKVKVSLFSFVWGAAVVVAVTVLTILFIALKSARANPVNSLKTE